MFAALIATGVSSITLLVLIVLFRHERARHARYAQAARATFDRLIFESRERLVYRYGRVSVRSIRQTVHFVFHQVLAVLISILGWIERHLRMIMHLNKRRANRPEAPRPAAPHLSALAEHKRSAELSEDEKRAARDAALRGK